MSLRKLYVCKKLRLTLDYPYNVLELITTYYQQSKDTRPSSVDNYGPSNELLLQSIANTTE